MDLVREERPDVKVENNGFEALTNVELLSFIIGGGVDKSLDLSRELYRIADCDLRKLRRMSVKKMIEVPGIGVQKANAILAAFELAKRACVQSVSTTKFDSSVAIYSYFRPKIGTLEHEEFWVMYPNQSFGLIKAKKINFGGLTECAVDVRVILREALLCNSTVIAVAHNHPSGNNRPSRQDDTLTHNIQKACETMRVYFLDHVIVTEDDYYSYRTEGRV